MSLPTSRPTRLDMRKELVRLRMEMHRQQLHYHSEPLRHPLQQIRHLLAPGSGASDKKTPLALGGALLLTLLGNRLGRVGKLARFALAVYPLIGAHMKQHPEERVQEKEKTR